MGERGRGVRASAEGAAEEGRRRSWAPSPNRFMLHTFPAVEIVIVEVIL
jgi:hypothetical protein